MRVLLYHEGCSDGGAENVVQELLGSFRDAGCEAALANCAPRPSPVAERWRAEGGQVSLLRAEPRPHREHGAPPPAGFEAWLSELIRSFRPGAFLAHNGGYPWHTTCQHAVLLARSRGTPRVLLALHSTPEPSAEGDGDFDREVAAACDAIVIGTSALAAEYSASRPALAPRLRVIPYGVADPGSGETPGDNGNGAVRFGMAAEMRNERKGQLVLLDAMARLREEARPCECWVAGDGDYLPELRSRAAARGLPVNFLGRVPAAEMSRRFYSRLDAYVLPSLQEGLSLTLLEAMAHSLPVVASDVGGQRDAVIDGETGRMVSPGDAGALAEALAALVGDPAGRRAMGRAGRRRYERLFTLDAFRREYLRILGLEGGAP